jgi:hypothetical protein
MSSRHSNGRRRALQRGAGRGGGIGCRGVDNFGARGCGRAGVDNEIERFDLETGALA